MPHIGGGGVMEASPFPRLFRESPIHALREGSGKVRCLNMLRAPEKSPATQEAFFAAVGCAHSAHAALDAAVAQLKSNFRDPSDIEYRSRDIVDRKVFTLLTVLLLQHAPAFLAHACRAARLNRQRPT